MDYYASDVALRNSKQDGFWIIIEECVYDVSHFLETHPGGDVILMNCSGRDASTEYKSVLHHTEPRIGELLKKLYVGRLISVSFSNNLLQDVYQQWYELLHLVLEMENTFRSDLSFLRKSCTHGENPSEINPYKVDLLLETHSRFVNGYLGLILEKTEKTKELITDPSGQPGTPSSDSCSGVNLSSARNSISRIREANARLRSELSLDQAECWDSGMHAYCALVEREDSHLLTLIKKEVVSGIKMFESRAVEATGGEIFMPFYSRLGAACIEYLRRIDADSRSMDELGQSLNAKLRIIQTEEETIDHAA